MNLRCAIPSAALAFASLVAGCSVFSSAPEPELPELPIPAYAKASLGESGLLRVTQITFRVRPSERFARPLSELDPILRTALDDDTLHLLRVFRDETSDLRAFVYPVQPVADFSRASSVAGRTVFIDGAGRSSAEGRAVPFPVDGDRSGASLESASRMLNGFVEFKLAIGVLETGPDGLPEGILHSPEGSRCPRAVPTHLLQHTVLVRADGAPLLLSANDSGPDDSGRVVRSLLIVQVFPSSKSGSVSENH